MKVKVCLIVILFTALGILAGSETGYAFSKEKYYYEIENKADGLREVKVTAYCNGGGETNSRIPLGAKGTAYDFFGSKCQTMGGISRVFVQGLTKGATNMSRSNEVRCWATVYVGDAHYSDTCTVEYKQESNLRIWIW